MLSTWAQRVTGALDHKVTNTVRRIDSNNKAERSIMSTHLKSKICNNNWLLKGLLSLLKVFFTEGLFYLLHNRLLQGANTNLQYSFLLS
jgi:hypothetical protein